MGDGHPHFTDEETEAWRVDSRLQGLGLNPEWGVYQLLPGVHQLLPGVLCLAADPSWVQARSARSE